MYLRAEGRRFGLSMTSITTGAFAYDLDGNKVEAVCYSAK
jgi:hypothetical protein